MAIAHGNTTISIEEDIVIIKSIGSFNQESIKQSFQEVKTLIKSIFPKKFKMLADYPQVEGATPESFETIEEINIWLKSQNMVAKAIVIKSSLLLSILKSRSPSRNTLNEKYFDDNNSAINWLKAQ